MSPTVAALIPKRISGGAAFLRFRSRHLEHFNIPITKLDEDRRIAFGWATVVERADGDKIVDHEGDVIDGPSLEKAVYEYVLISRNADEMHTKFDGVGRLVESMVFTREKLEKLGVPAGTLPLGWWVGFKIDDEAVWAKVKDGTYRMFSIFGAGRRVESMV